MKHLTGVFVLAALIGSAPLHAQDCSGTNCPPAGQSAQAQPATDAAPAKPADGTAAKEAKPQSAATAKPNVAAKPKKKPAAEDGTTSAEGTASTGDPKPAPKKSAGAPAKHSEGGVPVEKVGGKTCSGRDEYRVCW